MGVVGFDEVLYIHETKQKGRNKMWYDKNKLKDVNEIKIIIAKRTRKGRNTMKKELLDLIKRFKKVRKMI